MSSGYTITHIDAYRQPEERRFEILKGQPEYTRTYETRPRTCIRPGCDTELTDPFATFCPACSRDQEAAIAAIHAVYREARKERLARQAVQA